MLALLGLAQPAHAQSASAMMPGSTAIYYLFGKYRLVGLGDDHGIERAMDFYTELVSSPQFARDVGNVVVEFGAGGRQDVIDRYVAGEKVSYAELRTVWTDTVGWLPTAGYLGFAKFFAAVRATNKGLPPGKRVRVWLGEPPMDWSAPTPEKFMAAMNARDSYPAGIIDREIMAKGRKALVIYGGMHFSGGTWLGGRVAAAYPGAMFVVMPLMGEHPAGACTAMQELAAKRWPEPSIVVPVGRDPVLTECATLRGRSFSSAPAPVATGDAVILYSPPLGHYRSPWLPDYLLDTEYRREMARRAELGGPRLVRWPAGFVLRKSDYAVDLDAPGFREAVDAMFAAHDRNGDGQVTQDEYRDPIP
jgi:hypothetical protein